MFGRRGTTNRPSPGGAGVPASSSTGAVSVEAAPPYVAQFLEAVEACSRGYTPERARTMVQLIDHYPDMLAAMAQFAKIAGERSVQMVDMPPTAQQIFMELAGMQERAVDPVREGLQSVKRVLLDRIKRYQDGRSQDAAWDVEKNRD